MKDRYFCRQALFIINQLAVILYLVFLASNDIALPHNIVVQLGITTIVLFDAYYVSYKNIRNNGTLDKFSALLAVVAWYFLLGLGADIYPLAESSEILLSLVPFQTLSFTLAFLFQDSKYQYKRAIHSAMGVLCGATVLLRFVSAYAFNLCLLLQFVLTACVMIFVAMMHRNRLAFILKNQSTPIRMSLLFVLLPFALYALHFLADAPQLERIGEYLIYLLCFASIHSIIFYMGREEAKTQPLAFAPKVGLAALALAAAVLFGVAFGLSTLSVFVLIDGVQWFVQAYNMLLYVQTRKRLESGEYKHHDFYSSSLSGIQSEEALRSEISEFLHDDVLQDLLSVKILVKKSEQPEVRALIADTVEKLSLKVRSQMDQYHNVLLKSLTLKENYQNLIETTSQRFPLAHTQIVFTCPDDLFLAAPYHVIIYRIVKELMTNALKHAGAKTMTVSLWLTKDLITLEISDDGIGFEASPQKARLHKGLISVQDTVYALQGDMTLNAKVGQGTTIRITMPMKGERSYESFISR